MRVLHLAAEVFPLVKTGGLADVVAALPPALAEQGADVRLLLPGHPAVLDGVKHARPVATLGPAFGSARSTLLLGRQWRGWRGRRATRWLYAGAVLLLLAYVGSRFVFEVLVNRSLV